MAASGRNDNLEEGFLDDIAYNSDVIWKPIGLTYVEYIKGDLLGQLLAWCSLLPIFLGVSFVTLVIFRRDLHTFCFAAGIVVNEAVNWTLKHIIKEYRPDRTHKGLTTEYGMPSSHSQYMWFFSTYLVFFLFIRVHNNENVRDMIWKYLTAIGGLVAALIVAYSRVYLGYHSTRQVVCGAAVGSMMGGAWFAIVHIVLSPWFPAIASSTVGEMLMLRDSTLIPNVLWFEYCNHRAEMKNRLRKLSSRKLS